MQTISKEAAPVLGPSQGSIGFNPFYYNKIFSHKFTVSFGLVV